MSGVEVDARIRERFAEMFRLADAALPDPLEERGVFTSGDWSFRYVVNEVDGEPCVDVVASVDGTPQLERFLPTGDVESGPYLLDMVIFDPDVDADEDAARERHDEHNRMVGDVMRARRLL